ncbi:MAG: hypothetical protein AB8B73_12825 [Ekhidna sp.]
MRKLPLIIVSTLVLNFAMGQSVVTTSYLELTSISPKAGISVGVKNYYGIEYGGFYQESKTIESKFMSEQQRSELPRIYEKVFWGAYVGFPVVRRQAGEVQLNIRTGVVNSEWFVITPSLRGVYNVSRGIKVGGGLGVRAFRPTFQTSISLSI